MNEQLIGDLFAEAQRQMSGSSSREFSEKFAELIVKECNEVLRLVPYNSNVEFGDEVIYQDAIEKHFGVEE